MAVALYARVSTTKQAEKELSIPDQLRQMRDWCKRLKWPKYAGKGLLTVEAITPVYAPDKDGNSPALYAQAVNAAVAAWAAEDNAPAPAPKPITRWRCINQQGVNVRTAPNLKGREVGVIKLDQIIVVGLV